MQTLGLARSPTCRWEDHLLDLTPWEQHEGLWLKREDRFAPLGYGGPNGSKLRQLIWYVDRHRAGKYRIVTGASVQSPQLSMSAAVGAHYGLPTLCVVYSRPETVLRHASPRIAAGFGAEFDYARGPYNPIIQARVAQLLDDDSLLVPYGITLDHREHTPEAVTAFHEVGAHQVTNMPEAVRRLIVPAGSCNTLMSVVLGLSVDPKNLEELYTVGIGPDRTAWFRARAAHMGLELRRLPFRWRHVSLHDMGYARYDQRFLGERVGDVSLHPNYEAKVWRWLREHNPPAQDGSVGLWIVGGEADPRVVEPYFVRRD